MFVSSTRFCGVVASNGSHVLCSTPDNRTSNLVGSSLVSSACVRPRSAAFGSVLRCRPRTWVELGGLASLALKIGRSAVRPRPWPPPPRASVDPRLDGMVVTSAQLAVQFLFCAMTLAGRCQRQRGRCRRPDVRGSECLPGCGHPSPSTPVFWACQRNASGVDQGWGQLRVPEAHVIDLDKAVCSLP
jgi:hypothetical protein